MTAAQLLVKTLEVDGIKYIFGLPGEENLTLLDEIKKSSIEFITTRDEQTAVFMAATYGRFTGKVGVALSTLGPGATNLVTGVAYAQLAGMPLLVITGQKPVRKSKQGKFQIIDVVGMMKPITKFSESIVSADRVPTTVSQAIRLAEHERPGAVHIELAEDIALEESDTSIPQYNKVRRPIADEKSIAALIEVIQSAEKPVLVLGSSANRKLIRKQLDRFVEKTGIPFATTQMGKGVSDESSDLFLGTTALSDNDFIHEALKLSDLIIMIGHDIIEKPPVIDKGANKFVHINFYPADIDEVYEPKLEVVGDISHTLWAVTEDIIPKVRDYSEMLRIKSKLLVDIELKSNDDSFPIKPQRFVKDLRSIVPKDGILSLDNGMYKLWIARNYPAHEQNTVLLDNALATMGAGLPVGMAAKLLNPDKKVVVVAGDGGIMMNFADLETAIRLNLNLVVVVLNDSGYGMIKWKQGSMKLDSFGLEFKNPDFVKLAESFGAKGYKPSSSDEFKTLLAKLIYEDGVHIIDLAIDYSENITLDADNLKLRVNKILGE